VVFISCLLPFVPLGLVPFSSYIQSYFGNRVEFETRTIFPRISVTLKNCSTPACNKFLIQVCQFAVAFDYWIISGNLCVDSKMAFMTFLSLFLHLLVEAVKMFYGRQSALNILLLKVPEHA